MEKGRILSFKTILCERSNKESNCYRFLYFPNNSDQSLQHCHHNVTYLSRPTQFLSIKLHINNWRLNTIQTIPPPPLLTFRTRGWIRLRVGSARTWSALPCSGIRLMHPRRTWFARSLTLLVLVGSGETLVTNGGPGVGSESSGPARRT